MTNCRIRPSLVLLTATLLLSALISRAQITTNRTVLQQARQMKITQEQDIHKMVLSLAARYNWPLTMRNKQGRKAYLVGVSRTGHPIYITTNDNIISAATIRTTALWPGGSTGLGLSGSASYMSGLIGVWDEGKVRPTHVELNNRVTQVDGASTLIDHSTHVAGTLIAAGVNPMAKGMSFGALNLKAYDFFSDQSEMMDAAGNHDMLVSNHSYSITAGWYFNGDQNRWQWYGNNGDSIDVNFGLYDNDTRVWDSIAYYAPFYLMAKAAGNNRTVNGPQPTDASQTYYYFNNGNWVSATRQAGKISNNDGYMIIPTYGNAKNILTVGAVNPIPSGYNQPSDVLITDFSSWGPTGDGRIKPDVVADGANVLSSISTADNAYDVYSGTSMASPAAAGSAFLLQEYWSKLHGGAGHFMRSATLKGLLIHTADEAGPNPGPDYQYGWGLLNIQKAASVITSDTSAKRDQMIEEKQLINTTHDADSFTVVASGAAPLTATISWTDPPGVPVTNITSNFHDVGVKLINDLDLRITDVTSGTVYQPWVLAPTNPTAAATRGDNFRDNVEKVQVDNPIAGRTYKIKITHKGVLKQGTPTGSQAYSLLVSGAGGTTYCTSNGSATGTSITNVSLSGQNFATPGCKTYTDNTTAATSQLAIGQTVPINISYQTCSGATTTNIAVYIDYNNDGDFNDAGELVAQTTTAQTSTTTAAVFTGFIAVPVTVKAGTFTRMRIIAQDGATTTPTPCGTYPAGETQDYLVTFTAPSTDVGVVAMEYPTTGICASDSQIVTIRIRNFGSASQSNVPVTTVINNGGTTVATLTGVYKDAIPGQSSVTFTYNTTFKSTASASYTFTSTTSLSGDVNTGNDQNVAGLSTSAAATAASATATICGDNATTASLKTNASDNDIAVWYDSPTSTTPIAAGNTATATVIPSNKTYYLGLNELNTKLGPPNKNAAFTGGAGSYFRVKGTFVKITTGVPLTLESARMYFAHSGTLTITLAKLLSASGSNFSYSPLSTNVIDVYATRSTPTTAQQTGVAAGDNTDAGGIFNLNIPIPVPGDYILILDCSDSTSTFINAFGSSTSSNIPYPVSIPGVISITGNNQNNTSTNDTAYKKFWIGFYNLGIRLAGCPSGSRIPVVAGTTSAPVITQNGNVFTSSFDNGNQWYRSGTLLADSINKTCTAIYSGTYQTIVTDNATGCQLASNSIPFVSTGTTNVSGASIGLTVSPNPNDGAFLLQFYMATQDNTSIILLNTLGQKVYEEANPNFVGTYSKTINAGNLASGMYVLKIIHGNNTYIRKILVKK
ncbi:MAG: S8 family peptidase [Chitinophagaceae bacterium]|nr:S8 family peptidase [Chitinophagaceae bacterium]